MKKTLEMAFRNQSGKEIRLSLPDPKTDLTRTQVETVMQTIISKNIFTSKGGDLTQIVDVRLRSSDTSSLA